MVNYAASFHALRNLAGNPVLTCVKPRTEWTSVPAGYTFDESYDAYLNVGGTVWKPVDTDDLAIADYTTVPFLPGAGNAALELVAGGLVDTGSRFGRVLPGDIATVRAAQWFEINGFTYVLGDASPFPAGAALWYSLRLDKR